MAAQRFTPDCIKQSLKSALNLHFLTASRGRLHRIQKEYLIVYKLMKKITPVFMWFINLLMSLWSQLIASWFFQDSMTLNLNIMASLKGKIDDNAAFA